MPSVNKVILIGNITRDIEIKYTPKGTAVAEMGLAINSNFGTGDDKKEVTTFVDVTLWGRVAEIASEYAHKGNPIYVEGRLTLDSWEDKQSGQKRTKLKVIGENIQLLGGKKGNDAQQESRPSGGQSRANTSRRSEPEDDSSDIPF